MAEGVGFEPTVGFPTLDFESSALNRTQPPFLKTEETPNAQRPISNVEWQLCSTSMTQTILSAKKFVLCRRLAGRYKAELNSFLFESD
jgi:hypothetical protein